MDNGRYEIVGRFVSYGKCIVTVKLEHGTHVMPEEDWKWIFGQLRSERWGSNKRVGKNEMVS